MDRLVHAVACLKGADRQTGSNLLVLHWLSVFADEDGVAWPSAHTLEDRTGLDLRTVKRTLLELERLGAIQRSGTASRRVVRWTLGPGATSGEMATCRTSRKVAPMPPEQAVCTPPVTDDRWSTGHQSEPRQVVCTPPVQVVHRPPKEYMEEKYPPTPQGGTGSAPRTPTPAPAPAGHPQRPPNPDDYAGPPREAVVADQVFERIKRLGRVDREFAVRQVCVRFVAAGGGMPELEALIGEAGRPRADGSHRLGGGKIGIVVHWLEDAGRWRSVVGDSSERAKLSQIRKRASGVSTLVRSAEMVGAS